MPIPTAEHSYLRLTYRPDLRILFMRWTRLVSSQEHRTGYLQGLQFAREHQAGHWLVDLRTRGLAEAADFKWILQEFRPQMQQALPGISFRIAYLVTPYHQEVITSRLVAEEKMFRSFIEEKDAYQWLGTPMAEAS
ncbi:hypothetical protein [Hymenobacter sp. DG25B]|uniref:hypothetical protein n=1 Tax=Hymenobacter sp. DG25B TaxID=1385664 RepID=UPI000AF4484D|nr:hypothetical protein [Hymenobacter sp. DG25B]